MWPDLREYCTKTLDLTDAEVTALSKVLPSATISPSQTQTGLWDVTPGSVVGTISIGGRSLSVRPKIDTRRLMFMLAYTLDPIKWQDQLVDLDVLDNPIAVLVHSFLAHLRTALGPGVLQGYRTIEDSTMVVRGRIRFDEQIKRHHGQAPPVAVAFDEFTTDINENRLLRAALHRLRRLPSPTPEQRAALHRYDHGLSEVSLIDYTGQDLPEIHWTRLNGRYRNAVRVAQLILRTIAVEQTHGMLPASAFLVDMNKVFEDFVVAALRAELEFGPNTLVQGSQGRSLNLDSNGKVHLAPDLTIWQAGRCVFVGDCKYKRIDVSGIKHPDLYQLLAYTISTGLDSGLLVYAAGEAQPVVHAVPSVGKELHVAAVDLRGEPEQILGEIARMGELIGIMLQGPQM